MAKNLIAQIVVGIIMIIFGIIFYSIMNNVYAILVSCVGVMAIMNAIIELVKYYKNNSINANKDTNYL